jgi:hypothetical protein
VTSLMAEYEACESAGYVSRLRGQC